MEQESKGIFFNKYIGINLLFLFKELCYLAEIKKIWMTLQKKSGIKLSKQINILLYKIFISILMKIYFCE